MKKKIIILISIILIISILAIILLNNKNSKKTIEAEILVVGSDYLLVSTTDNIDYIIETKNTDYRIGDKLKLELINIDKNRSPYEANAKNITIITESPNIKEENTTSNDEFIKEESNIENNQTPKEDNYSETDVINYFKNLDSELTTIDNKEDITDTIKSKFVKCIDFLFYEEEIGGITFKELTNNTKLKILEITMSIDSKIDSKFPGYKDTISNKYQDIKSKTIELYLNTTTSICNNDKELCQVAKEGFSDLKETFGITWEVIKDLAGTGISKLKDWYEIWRYN